MITDATIIECLPQVDRIVNGMRKLLPRHIPRNDLLSAATYGLVDAARTFDPELGVPLSGHASARIRGQIKDDLRKLDILSRGDREGVKSYQLTFDALESKLGRSPTNREVAIELDVPITHVDRAFADASNSMCLRYDTEGQERYMPSTAPSPEQLVIDIEDHDLLLRAIEELPERLRFVVEKHLDEGTCYARSCAEYLGVSESRVYQIYGEAVRLLRSKLIPRPP